jgi:serine/threonine-protein kinase
MMLGPYRLTRKLGQGRLGPVYLAFHTSLGREVALKFLSPELAGDPDLVARFLQDAQRLARLRYPSILECFEVGQALGHHFLALEFIEEGSAGTWLKKLGKFPLGDSLYLIVSCCHALHYAHELQVVHGNIKPDNVLLPHRGGVKVADAGLLRSHGGDLALSRTAAGAETLFYLAPEQLRDGKQPDPRSDLYSLGCLLYVCLTGETPFKGKTLAELLEAKERGPLKPARTLNRDVPERLDRIIEKLLAVRPEERHASCAALMLDLEALGLAHRELRFLRPTPAAPPPSPSSPTPPPAPRELHARDLQGVEGYWYVTLTGPDGKSTKVRKVTYRQVIALLKSKTIDASTTISQSRHGTYQPLGSYPEFGSLGKLPSGKPAEPMDLTAWLEQEIPKRGVRSRGRGREREHGHSRELLRDPVGLRIPRRWVIWGGTAAALLIFAWFLFGTTPGWRLQNFFVHLFH